MPPIRPIVVLIAAVALVLAVAGCSSPGPEFVAEGRTYTVNSALDLPAQLDAGDLAAKPTSDAQKLRHDALVELRQEGGIAADAARIVTATFPADTDGVPFYVERAMYDSVPAIVLVEAIGPSEGKLSDRRVWVISLEGDVLLSGTR